MRDLSGVARGVRQGSCNVDKGGEGEPGSDLGRLQGPQE